MTFDEQSCSNAVRGKLLDILKTNKLLRNATNDHVEKAVVAGFKEGAKWILKQIEKEAQVEEQ